MFEKIGKVLSWIFLALLGTNGITNSLWEGNDLSALMDSIDGT